MNEYLYHYTNVESLALILKNKTIRLNSLDKMDDLQEKEVGDLKNLGQFCYVSSWTDDEKESIPMWNMYTDMKSGVRIKMKKNPFKLFENNPDELKKITNMQIIDNSNGNYYKSYKTLVDFMNNNYFSIPLYSNDILFQVEYTDEKEKLYPFVLTEEGTGFSISLDKLGKYKNTYWNFQSEWRYLAVAIPFDFKVPLEQMYLNFNVIANRMKLGIEKQPVQFIDLVIDENSFEEMEIVLSPKISYANKIIVSDLIEKYNPNAVIIESKLAGLI